MFCLRQVSNDLSGFIIYRIHGLARKQRMCRCIWVSYLYDCINSDYGVFLTMAFLNLPIDCKVSMVLQITNNYIYVKWMKGMCDFSPMFLMLIQLYMLYRSSRVNQLTCSFDTDGKINSLNKLAGFAQALSCDPRVST